MARGGTAQLISETSNALDDALGLSQRGLELRNRISQRRAGGRIKPLDGPQKRCPRGLLYARELAPALRRDVEEHRATISWLVLTTGKPVCDERIDRVRHRRGREMAEVGELAGADGPGLGQHAERLDPVDRKRAVLACALRKDTAEIRQQCQQVLREREVFASRQSVSPGKS